MSEEGGEAAPPGERRLVSVRLNKERKAFGGINADSNRVDGMNNNKICAIL